ncbi:hypothetical protein B6V76_17015 [Thioclava sp. IC9]|nr:hypothetical protein B6V76_17015 [Thioclava sp. IC9]
MIPFPMPEMPKGLGSQINSATVNTGADEAPSGDFALVAEAAAPTTDEARNTDAAASKESGAGSEDDQSAHEEREGAVLRASVSNDLSEVIVLLGRQKSHRQLQSASTVERNQVKGTDIVKPTEKNVAARDGDARPRGRENGAETDKSSETHPTKAAAKVAETTSVNVMTSAPVSSGITMQPHIEPQRNDSRQDGLAPRSLSNREPLAVPSDAREQRTTNPGQTSAVSLPARTGASASDSVVVHSAEHAPKTTFDVNESLAPAPENEQPVAEHVASKRHRKRDTGGTKPLRSRASPETLPAETEETARSAHAPPAEAGTQAPSLSAESFFQGRSNTAAKANGEAIRAVIRHGPEAAPAQASPNRGDHEAATPVFTSKPATSTEAADAMPPSAGAAGITVRRSASLETVETVAVSAKVVQSGKASDPHYALAAKAPPVDAEIARASTRWQPPPQPQFNTARLFSTSSDTSKNDKAEAREPSVRVDRDILPMDVAAHAPTARMSHAQAIYLGTAALRAAQGDTERSQLPRARFSTAETPETSAAHSAPLAAGTGGAAPTSSAPQPAPASIAQSIAHQIGISLQRMPDRPVEIALSPKELGHVRMILHASQHGMTVAIQADRAETLDLMRRHIDTFAREIHDLGYGTLDFQFSQREERPQRRPDIFDRSGTGPGVAHIETPIDPNPRPATRLAPHKGGLDLRM